MLEDTIPQKRCACCKNIYPLGSFPNSSITNDGKHAYCRKCAAEKKGRKFKPHCIMPDGYRQCGHCGEVLPHSEFNKNKNCRGGLSNKCRACSIVYDSNWLNENRERNKENSKRRYYEKPEARAEYKAKNADKIAAAKREYRKAHPEETKKHKRENLKRHPEANQRRHKRYNERHPELQRMRGRITKLKHDARLSKDIKRSDLMAIYEVQEGRCAYCGITIFWDIQRDMHVDHIQPVTKGGSNELDNLCLTCVDCNVTKSNLTLSDWLLSRGW